MRRLFITALVCICSLGAFGQGMKDMRINEVLVSNTDNYVDGYGHRESWLEVHNTGYSSVNLAGGYLRLITDGGDSTTYRIPKNDPRTNIAPQDYAVFFCEGTGSKGTFYTNFIIKGKGKLQLYDASGRGAPVSEIEFDEEQTQENVSMGWATLAQGEPETWHILLPETTPGSTNNTVEFIGRAELFRMEDPSGIIMALTAMTVVFLALLALFQVFKLVGKIMVRRAAKKDAAPAQAAGVETPKATLKAELIPEETMAAIGMALRQYEKEMRDEESAVLTINRVARSYSPWSSKIYGIMNQPAPPTPRKR